MNFITATRSSSNTSILINSMMVVAIQPTPANGSVIYTMGGSSWDVLESVDEIKKKIKTSESFTITNHNK